LFYTKLGTPIGLKCAIAFAMKLVDRDYLSEETVGRSLQWGDSDALIELARKSIFAIMRNNQKWCKYLPEFCTEMAINTKPF
jgi:hypothetical protein